MWKKTNNEAEGIVSLNFQTKKLPVEFCCNTAVSYSVFNIRETLKTYFSGITP